MELYWKIEENQSGFSFIRKVIFYVRMKSVVASEKKKKIAIAT